MENIVNQSHLVGDSMKRQDIYGSITEIENERKAISGLVVPSQLLKEL